MPGPKPRRRVPSTEDIFLFIDGFNAPTTLTQLHPLSISIQNNASSSSLLSMRSGDESGASSPVSETSDNSTPPSPSGSTGDNMHHHQGRQHHQRHASRSSLGSFPFETPVDLAVPQPAALNLNSGLIR
ncbi:hypothetical protein NLI96_g7193 [Meripilus lineatus]|uniref:Uncharacterized protein n=1 Tax=Meripilus lineatus TaxID=2056292 RepID=A0AAD5YCA2_9APHY|nr:hypothetical protein NLI96_g7193 [Physisporinus lineatus]